MPHIPAEMTAIRLAAWGGYDHTKPRVRLLLEALRRKGALARDIHVPVWNGVEDKSVAGYFALLRAAFAWLAGMPRALVELARLPAGIDLLLPYPGTPDIFLASLLARKNRRRIVLDAFLPIHDTIVGDRALVTSGGILARLIARFERAGLSRADYILVDTDAQGDFLSEQYGIPRERFWTVLVGAEPLFERAEPLLAVDDLVGADDGRKLVLFYGQFIPLHGIATILDAARRYRGPDAQWIVVGRGQQEAELRRQLEGEGRAPVTWIPWVEYARLPSLIARADLCLGIFGGTAKAARVIPNKVFQVLAMGKPVVTRSSPAIDPLARAFPDAIRSVPAEDSAALAEAVADALTSEGLRGLPDDARAQLMPDAGLDRLIARMAAGADGSQAQPVGHPPA